MTHWSERLEEEVCNAIAASDDWKASAKDRYIVFLKRQISEHELSILDKEEQIRSVNNAPPEWRDKLLESMNATAETTKELISSLKIKVGDIERADWFSDNQLADMEFHMRYDAALEAREDRIADQREARMEG